MKAEAFNFIRKLFIYLCADCQAQFAALFTHFTCTHPPFLLFSSFCSSLRHSLHVLCQYGFHFIAHVCVRVSLRMSRS